jgi:hypothetical protein
MPVQSFQRLSRVCGTACTLHEFEEINDYLVAVQLAILRLEPPNRNLLANSNPAFDPEHEFDSL